jgi:hypothetical protein
MLVAVEATVEMGQLRHYLVHLLLTLAVVEAVLTNPELKVLVAPAVVVMVE